MKTSGYNIMRDDSAILEEHENYSPSFSVRLYPDHWTLNNGPKFTYNNHVSSILEDIRAFRIPTDFIQIFDEAAVPYYSGCLIVELLDFRPSKAKEPILEQPDKQRVVLRPNAETVWADICIMNAKTGSKWSDKDALQVESKLLLSTSTPLCLNPDPSLTRVVNSILRVSTPNVPNSLKRKAAAMVDLEEDETEKAKRAKIMQFMNPQFSATHKAFHPNYKILAIMEQRRAAQASQQNSQPASNAPPPNNLPSGTMAPPNLTNHQASEKPSATVVPTLTTSYSQSNAILQPAPTTTSQTQPPPQLQLAVDPSQRQPPSKQQQSANNPITQRPPSQPAAASHVNVASQQSQAQAQQPTQQPAHFNPPLPPSNFLNAPPANRRRPSTAVKPSTPAVANSSLPNQQSINQNQTQARPQAQQQASAQSLVPPQQVQPPTQPVRPAHIPANMPSMQNMAQFYQNGRAVPTAQAAATAATQRPVQRQALSGRNTPVNAANPNASPVPPPPSALARSPMVPPAAVAAMMSRQNTPVATNNQVARGSPLAGNHPVAARAVAGQIAAQQQPQQPILGGQAIMMQAGTSANSANLALAYQYQLQNEHRIQAYRQARAQHQAQMQQQGQMSPAPQQQQNAQSANAQAQQTTQDQSAGVQQNFAGVQMPFNYMQMNMNLAAQNPQQYLWAQRSMGRGMVPVPNGQQQIPVMPPTMTMQQMQGLGRTSGPPNR